MAVVASVILVGLSLILGVRLLRQYATRPRPHTFWYAIGLLMIVAAATPELYFELTGQVPTLLWWLYWMTGGSLVGFLAVGTAYLMSVRFGHAVLAAVALTTLWVAVATVLTAGAAPAEVGVEMFRSAPTADIKRPFLMLSIGGTLVLLVGAVLSYIRTRGLFAVLIALGTLVFAGGHSAASRGNMVEAFVFAQTAGILLLYTGVSLSLRPPKKEKVDGQTRAAES
ncbi:MAG: hypothetical protein ACOY94_00285 [Bacillota bacterium]